jgi:hypothetical protein
LKGARCSFRDEKKQLFHRLPPEFVRRILSEFNAGNLDAAAAAVQLGIAKTRLYELRSAWLGGRDAFRSKASGGAHRGIWPHDVLAFLAQFVPLASPPNFQLVADELKRLFGFVRARSSVEAFLKTHLPHLLPAPPPRIRTYRRFRRAHIGELWQHDSSIHQWWPAAQKQILLLTVDDHSGLNVAGRFVTADTTWNHFCHFRSAFENHSIPEAIYTDALSLFGPSSSSDRSDPRSEFQRALRRLGIAHLVAPTPQAKGKIERRFGTFQCRLVTLLAHAKVTTPEHADELLQMELQRQNRTRQRSTGLIPLTVWENSLLARTQRLRPTPATPLLDLHLSLRQQRRVNNDHTIDFEGRNYEIARTSKSSVTLIHHPQLKFWVVEHPPANICPPHSRRLFSVIRCPLLFRQQFRFCTVADR